MTVSSLYNQLVLESSLKADGWVEDRYGHFHKSIEGRRNRIKFQSVSVRIEIRSTCKTFWIKKTGEFYSKIKIDHEKKMINVGKSNFPLLK